MEGATAAPPRPSDDGLEDPPEPDPIRPEDSPSVPPEDPPAPADDQPEPEETPADLGEETPEEPQPEGLTVKGDGKQLTLSVGGETPTSSEFKLQGGKIALEGQFKKGQIVRFEVTARVGEVHFVDKVDSASGEVTSTKRLHKARVEGVNRID